MLGLWCSSYMCLMTYTTCNIFSFFFFSSRRRHTRCSRDWSSDVCSSDLVTLALRTGDIQRWIAGGDDGGSAAAARPHIASLAVLPLANLSGDPSQEYFADGMTDELITNL